MATETTTAGHGGDHTTVHAHAHGAPPHPYHLVDPSPWPAVGTLAAFVLVIGGLMYMHEVTGGIWVVLLGAAGVIFTMFAWWRDVLREGHQGFHTDVVARGLRVGMVLFIASELLFFVAWFWAYFWGALVPPMTVETQWPPADVTPVDPWDIPFLNTMILLLSGTTVTWAHHELREGNRRATFQALVITVILGVLFTSLQAYEYVHAVHEGLTITDGIFGSSFYMATGFHGFHVLVGTAFLLVCTMRAYYGTLAPERHVGFEAAAWYWHFVDVVWLFLFVWVYWWAGSGA
ncbi:MAG TPA: cytochrome c oxidase subunit 3 [Geminicoccaceae bacterium]|jgi:cytochrome c oxidase subunit 3|nr:cytochrome c oxidase subunit 3 [Geminicoccaceae bacterium]